MTEKLKKILNAGGVSLPKRILVTALALLIATAIWLPLLHLLYRPRVGDYFAEGKLPPRARALAEWHLDLWTNAERRAEAIERMRGSNAEWDFMGRTFLVLALANMSLREPEEKDLYLEVMDTIIDETLRLEKQEGMYFFLMPYAQDRPWVNQPPRSLFVDGEIALMLGARQTVEARREYALPLAGRVDAIVRSMKKSPVLSGESYPDECWTFCNSVALAAIRVSDTLDRRDHSALVKRWLRIARERLVEKETGLLISEYTTGGYAMDGPEGSSLWMVAHCLSLVDEAFARDQYERARRELVRRVLGFGYAREWPPSCPNTPDIDSGPIVPVLEISPGSSGLAFLGAATFGDTRTLSGLLTSLHYGGFPVRRGDRLRFAASNQVGDAVLLYAAAQGPLWEVVRKKARRLGWRTKR